MILIYEIVLENCSFGGMQGVYCYQLQVMGMQMIFVVYLLFVVEYGKVLVLWYLLGLICMYENVMIKVGVQEWVVEYGIVLIFFDILLRGEGVVNDDVYDLGQGVGFYVDVMQELWLLYFRMWYYIIYELLELVFGNFVLDCDVQGIIGYLMGGYGVLIIVMMLLECYKFVLVFLFIVNFSEFDWGCKQFIVYLGDDKVVWQCYDVIVLMCE